MILWLYLNIILLEYYIECSNGDGGVEEVMLDFEECPLTNYIEIKSKWGKMKQWLYNIAYG